MRFECSIDMSNDAFVEAKHFELSKILKHIANDVQDREDNIRAAIIRDTNGGKVGTWKIIGE
jgi:hypothetical protein